MSDPDYDEYARSPGLSWSRNLRAYGVSGLHGYHAEHAVQADTDAYRLGRLLHCMVLEAPEVERRYVALSSADARVYRRWEASQGVPVEDLAEHDALLRSVVAGTVDETHAVYDGARNARHRAYQEWMAEHPGVQAVTPRAMDEAMADAGVIELAAGRTVVPESDWDTAQAMAAAVCESPAGELLHRCVREAVVRWVDPATGALLKAKIDAYDPDSRVLVDLKMTRDADRHGFARACYQYGYHAQLGGQYRQACIHGLGWTPDRVLLVVVERTAPHDVMIAELGAEEIGVGERHWRAALSRREECRRTGQYPGRYSEIVDLALPGYAYDVDDEIIVGGE